MLDDVSVDPLTLESLLSGFKLIRGYPVMIPLDGRSCLQRVGKASSSGGQEVRFTA